jgi:predicted aspartyl protease
LAKFTVPLQIGGAADQFALLDALVSTGATHTVIPRPVLVAVGVEPLGEATFKLGNGEVVVYQVGEARLRLLSNDRTSIVVFGPSNATPLLGTATLALFNLAPDISQQHLVPDPGILGE